jgi:dinuclear metal center YbgI/SA1388 family protein
MKNKRPRTAKSEEVVCFLDKELNSDTIPDVSRNGLQVQGAERISRLGLAVDACMDVYAAAAEKGCQMVVAHHGLIWGGLAHITKSVYRQIKFLFENGINLYAAHLPLDLHPEYGNNAQIARMLGLKARKPFGDYKGISIGFQGMLPKQIPVQELSGRLEKLLGGKNTLLTFGKKEVKSVAVVSGGAGDIIEEAISKNVDCYVTGEPRHEQYHLAKEAGLNVIYCGHYHSEKAGVLAIGKLLEKKFGIETIFLDVPTII